MDEYVAVSNPTGGRQVEYRLNRVGMERHGRWQSLTSTVKVFLVLLVLQYPMRQAAVGTWETPETVALATSARLGLLVDLTMIGVYLVLVWRALELVWAWERRSRLRYAAYTAAAAVAVGAALVLAENAVLWAETADPLWRGDLSVGWSGWKLGLVLGGLVVLLVITRYAWHQWGQRPPEAEAERTPTRRPGRAICCSDGGVRSASFCLGGLQVLTDEGLYGSADHVIGVSGGGYIAAAFHTARWHSHTCDEDVSWADLDPPTFAPDTPEVQRLRRNSSYLLDSGTSALRGVLSLCFGIAVNLVVLTAAIVAIAWILAWYVVAAGGWSGWAGGAVDTSFADPWAWALWVWLLPVFGALLFVLEKVVDKYWTAPFEMRIRVRRRSGGSCSTGRWSPVCSSGSRSSSVGCTTSPRTAARPSPTSCRPSASAPTRRRVGCHWDELSRS